MSISGTIRNMWRRSRDLQGDSLKTFMKKYRPSYDYCRKAATVDILVYINDCYKQYMKPAE